MRIGRRSLFLVLFLASACDADAPDDASTDTAAPVCESSPTLMTGDPTGHADPLGAARGRCARVAWTRR